MADKSFWSDKKDKTWLKNFWFYYRIHVIVAIIAVVVLAFSIRDCATRIDADISIDYIGEAYFSEEASDAIKSNFAKLAKDVDGKDGVNVNFVQHTMQDPDKGGDPQMAMAVQQAVMIEMTVGESYLYLIDDSSYKAFEDNEILLDLSTVDSSLPKNTYSVNLSGNSLFESYSKTTGKSVHMCVRTITPSIKERNIPKAKAMQENAIIIFNEFMKHQK